MALRQLVGRVVSTLGDAYGHRDIAEVCERLGLPTPPGKDEASKRERFERSFAALPDDELPTVAHRLLDQGQGDAATRNAIQDILWAPHSTLEIPRRTRHEIARDLDLDHLVHRPGRFRELLDRLWVLDDDPFSGWLSGPGHGLGARSDQHVFRSRGDRTVEELFEQLGAFDAGDARFVRFLEGLVRADVIPDEQTQRWVVDIINPHLHAVAAELREVGDDGGYPVFHVVSTRSARTGQPKTLIFATLAKPDIRFGDVLDNDMEILSDPDDVLAYDCPISADGLLWRDLQTWWQATRDIPDDAEAKRSLYKRLVRSLPEPEISPPQRHLFDLYHEIHGPAVHNLPALLPEVWLHWDPKTVRERGREALLRFRMDFLLLLPRGQRVVLEVDGSQHYTRNGQPDPATYAAGMRGDRELKLSGYEVFRFGAYELRDRDRARLGLEEFFAALFQRFGVSPLSG